MYTLAIGRPPFEVDSPDWEAKLAAEDYYMPSQITLSDRTSTPLKAVIRGLLRVDPTKRLTLSGTSLFLSLLVECECVCVFS